MGIRRWLRELTAGTEEREVLVAMRETPSVGIGALGDNTHALIAGVVEPRDDVRFVAPLSGRTCLWWGLAISGGESVARPRRGVPFFVVEAGHAALVDPEGARAIITATHFSRGDQIRGTPAQLRLIAQLDRAGYRRGAMFRFAEWAIVPGARLAVVGTSVREVVPIATANTRMPPTQLRIVGSPLAITDELDLIGG